MPGTDPFSLFDSFYRQALTLPLNEPTAMALATANAQGQPSVRIVLLKKHTPDGGFVFFTNKESRKGDDLSDNPSAALCLHRDALEQQFRIEGVVEPLSDDENDAYFKSRARLSKIGAWASQQSRPLSSRDTFLAELARYDAMFKDEEPPRPPYWGGYRLIPHYMEYWRNIPGRLHERRVFTRDRTDTPWQETLLYP